MQKQEKGASLWALFQTFAKIGLFTFGGGYAMIAVIEHTCVAQKQWISQDEMMDVMVLAESTPGPFAINCATYVGYRQAGLRGSLISTLGIVLPSLVILYVISVFFDNFLAIRLIANAFQGIKIAVGLLILNAGLTMLSKMPKTLLARCITAGACLATLVINALALHFSSILLMLAAGVISLSVYWASRRRKGDNAQ